MMHREAQRSTWFTVKQREAQRSKVKHRSAREAP